MSSEYHEIGENSYFQSSQQNLNDLQRQHQHQMMFHFNHGQPDIGILTLHEKTGFFNISIRDK